MLHKFWKGQKDPDKYSDSHESPEVVKAREERIRAEKLLAQTREKGVQVSRIANKSRDILEANNFTRTIDLCMERRK